MRRILLACLVAIACIGFATPTALALDVGIEALPESEWREFEDSIPDTVRDKLADGSDVDAEGFASGVAQMSSSKYIVSELLDMLGVGLGDAVKLLLSICAILMISAIFSALGENAQNPALLKATRFCSVGAIISVVIYLQSEHFEVLETLLGSLGKMVSGIIPMTACIWAMGGNVSTAGAGSAAFSLLLGVVETVLASTLLPVCSSMTMLGFCDALTDEVRMGKIMNAIKKIYNFSLSLIMTVMLSSLAAQTALAASADSAAARTARLVSGTVIPILGGSVGDTFRSVAAGVSYLKNVFGIGSIIMIALLVLPVVITLALTRFAFLVSAGFADMLGCSSESRALENLGEVYGTMLAVVSGVGVTFVIALSVFMRSVVAVA